MDDVDNGPNWVNAVDKICNIDSRNFDTIAAALRCGEMLERSGWTVRWLYVVPPGVSAGQWRCGKEEFEWALVDERAADLQGELPLVVATSTREILRLVKVV